MILKVGKTEQSVFRDGKALNLFVCGIFLIPIYIKLMDVLATVFSFPTTITTYMYYSVLWILFFASLPNILQRINTKVLFNTIYVVTLLAISMNLHPGTRKYVLDADFQSVVTFTSNCLILSADFIFVGIAITDIEGLSKLLQKSAKIGIAGGALTYIIMLSKGMSIHYDDMSMAYSLSLLLCILVSHWEKNDIIYFVFGSICLIIAGTRGPILCVILSVLFKFVIFEKETNKKIGGILLCICVGSLVYSGIAFKLLELISSFLSRFGVKNLRILDYVNNGMLLDGSGRDNYIALLIDAIKEKPFGGYGIGGDRILLPSGSYSHNLIIEAFVSVGIIIGGAFLAWIGLLSYKILTSADFKIRKLGIGLFCGIVIKLFLSSSIILSKEFFIFLGLCIAVNKAKTINNNNNIKGRT